MRESFALFLSKNPQDVDMVDLFTEKKDYYKIFKDNPIPEHTSAELVGKLS